MRSRPADEPFGETAIPFGHWIKSEVMLQLGSEKRFNLVARGPGTELYVELRDEAVVLICGRARDRVPVVE